MRFSAIEIGTNSTKFIIAQLTEVGAIEVITRTSTVNRLSSGMYMDNDLKLEAIEKEIEIIDSFIDESRKHGAKLLSIFSTSVLRDADNKEALLSKVKEIYGVEISIISGDREAYLAYIACKQLVEDKEKIFAVIDIGGGSTEIVVGKGECLQQKASLDVGAVRLTEMFVKHDPISDSELEQISIHIEKKINEMDLLELNGIKLIGTGGTIKCLGTIFFQEDYGKERLINSKVINRQDIEILFEKLKPLNIERKKKIVGLNPKRADVITTGVNILLIIMRKFNIEKIKISTQGVLEGFITEYIQTTPNERKSG